MLRKGADSDKLWEKNSFRLCSSSISDTITPFFPPCPLLTATQHNQLFLIFPLTLTPSLSLFSISTPSIQTCSPTSLLEEATEPIPDIHITYIRL